MRRLGEFEQMLLFALLRLGDEAHSVSVRQEIEKRTHQSVSPGATFTALERLEGRGLVESWFGESTPERGGKRKRHYVLTVAGAEALNRSYETLRQMSAGQTAKLRQLSESGE